MIYYHITYMQSQNPIIMSIVMSLTDILHGSTPNLGVDMCSNRLSNTAELSVGRVVHINPLRLTIAWLRLKYNIIKSHSLQRTQIATHVEFPILRPPSSSGGGGGRWKACSLQCVILLTGRRMRGRGILLGLTSTTAQCLVLIRLRMLSMEE